MKGVFDFRYWLIAISSPLLLLVKGVGSSNYTFKRAAIIIFTICYGMTMPMTDLWDGWRHRQMVYDEYVNMSLGRFLDDAFKIITFQLSSSSTDLYKHFISFWAGSVLQMPGSFFFWVSLVYGFFYSWVLLYAFQYVKSKGFLKQSWIPLTFIALFLLNKNFEGVQTVRTWTGMWVMIYGLIKFLETKKKRYWLFLLIAPISIHVGYSLMVIPIAIAALFHKSIKIYYILFAASFFFSAGVGSVANFIPELQVATQKVQQYGLEEDELNVEANLEKTEKKTGKSNSQRTWYKILQLKGFFMYNKGFLVFILFLFRIPDTYMNKVEYGIVAAGIATLAGSNFFSFIFAASNRMEIIGFELILLSCLLVFTRLSLNAINITKNRLFHLAFSLFIIGFIPEFIWLLSYGLSIPSLFLIVIPFFPLLSDYNISIIDAIKTVI